LPEQIKEKMMGRRSVGAMAAYYAKRTLSKGAFDETGKDKMLGV
jgi:hypothetical protein